MPCLCWTGRGPEASCMRVPCQQVGAVGCRVASVSRNLCGIISLCSVRQHCEQPGTACTAADIGM